MKKQAKQQRQKTKSKKRELWVRLVNSFERFTQNRKNQLNRFYETQFGKPVDQRQAVINSLTNWQRHQVEKTMKQFGGNWNVLSLETLQQAAKMKRRKV